MSDYDTWKTALPDEPPCKHERATHGSAALNADAAMLLAMGADPGPMECPDCGELVDHKPEPQPRAESLYDLEPF